jgi:hypothetical protein
MYEWNSNPPYIFCLSGSKDLLSQWRAYSNDGHGVSIGFNTKKLNIKNELPAPNVYAKNTLGMGKIQYYNHFQKKQIIELCENVKTNYDRSENDIDKIYAMMDLCFSLINFSLVFKNSSFKEEREWRILHTPTSRYEEPLEQLSDINFRLGQNKIISYFEFRFKNNFDSKLITEVVLGPKCIMKVDEVKRFLQMNGLKKTKVTVSKSTYR